MNIRQQSIPDRSHIKIVLRGPSTEHAHTVPQPCSDRAAAAPGGVIESVSCLIGKDVSIIFDFISFSIQSASVKSVISHGTQMHLGIASCSRQLELKPPDVQVCITLVVCNVCILVSLEEFN